jgi:hypothetical protein
MPTEPQPPTVAEVVRRAVDVCDTSGADADLGRLLERFEDADEPAGSPEAVRDRVAAAVEDLDPGGLDGALRTAGAVATYLAFRRDELDAPATDLLRLAARSEFDGDPPEPVAGFLAAAGVDA